MNAVNSLFDISVLDKGWKSISLFFDNGAYRHEVNNWHGVPFTILVFCTFHPSVTNVNNHIAKRYNKFVTEKLIQKKLALFSERQSITNFLKKYSNIDANASHRGMRYLLNHWLDIGSTIRSVHAT